MLSTLFQRGKINPATPFILVGQSYSNSLGIPGDNVLLNYSLSQGSGDEVYLNFSSSQSPLYFTARQVSPPTLVPGYFFIISEVGTGNSLCVASSGLVLSSTLSPFIFDFSQPLMNLPNSVLLSSTPYSVSFGSLPIVVPSGTSSLVGNGEVGYFCNDPLSSSIVVSSLSLFFLSQYYYSSSSTPFRTGVVDAYIEYITNPSVLINPPEPSWVGSGGINQSTTPFNPPMLWYQYCNFTTQCGDCYGAILVGGIECSLNSQLPVSSPPSDGSIPVVGKAFIPTGPPGNQGELGLPGVTGSNNSATTLGLKGEKGERGESSPLIAWNSGMGLFFIIVVVLCLMLIAYTTILVVPKVRTRVFF